MDANKHLVFGVAINGVKHPLRLKWYNDDEALVKNICDWIPIIMLRAASGGVNAGYELGNLPKHSLGVHIAYWYDASMYYYVEVVGSIEKDFFVPSPAVAPFYSELDGAPITLSAAAAFNNLWAAVQERKRVEEAALSIEELRRREMAITRSRYRERYLRGRN